MDIEKTPSSTKKYINFALLILALGGIVAMIVIQLATPHYLSFGWVYIMLPLLLVCAYTVWKDKILAPGLLVISVVLSINSITDTFMYSEFKNPVSTSNKQLEEIKYPRNTNVLEKMLVPNIFERADQLSKYPTADTAKILTNSKETENFINSNETVAIVFYKIGCPYCEEDHKTINDAINKHNVNELVRYVNYESDLGHELEKKYNVVRSTTVIVFSNGQYSHQFQQNIYKDSVRTFTPDTKTINENFKNLVK